MASDKLVVNRGKIAHETIDDEVIIINLETGTYYSLVESAVPVWNVLEQGATREQVVDAIAAQFAAPRADVATAVNPFLDELVREQILVATDEPEIALTPAAPVSYPFSAPTLARFTNMSDLLLLDPIHDVDEQGWPSKRSG